MIVDSNDEAGRCYDRWKTPSDFCVVICPLTDIVRLGPWPETQRSHLSIMKKCESVTGSSRGQHLQSIDSNNVHVGGAR